MTQPAATATAAAKSLLQEYATEVGKPPEPGAPAKAGSGPDARPAASGPAANLEMVMRIPVTVKVVLGGATMPVANLVKLGRGAIIPLDRRVGEPVDVVVNGRIVARGEVVVVDEATSRFGVSLTEIVGPTAAEKAS
jgi:flagellar motor switch protein FliN/FliY